MENEELVAWITRVNETIAMSRNKLDEAAEMVREVCEKLTSINYQIMERYAKK